jgi:hypothetical protein
MGYDIRKLSNRLFCSVTKPKDLFNSVLFPSVLVYQSLFS